MIFSLEERLFALGKAANEYNCRLVTEFADAASESELQTTEEFIGAPLPASLRQLLERHNGLNLYVCARDDVRVYDVSDIEVFAYGPKLAVHSASDIVRITKNFREYLDVDDETLVRTNKCFDFANSFGALDRVVFYTDVARANGEYAILNADISEGLWERELFKAEPSVIAKSFDEFIERSVEFMLTTRRGFAYWHPHVNAMRECLSPSTSLCSRLSPKE